MYISINYEETLGSIKVHIFAVVNTAPDSRFSSKFEALGMTLLP